MSAGYKRPNSQGLCIALALLPGAFDKSGNVFTVNDWKSRLKIVERYGYNPSLAFITNSSTL